MNKLITFAIAFLMCLTMPVLAEETVLEIQLNNDNGFYLQSTRMSYGLSETEMLAAKAIAEGLKRVEAEIDISEYLIGQNRISYVINEVINNDPEVFFIDYRFSGTAMEDATGVYWMSVIPTYKYEKSVIEEMLRFVRNERDRIAALPAADMSDFEKLLYIHDYFVLDYEYDYSYTKRDIYTFLSEKTGVCQAYSTTVKYVLDAMGIETICVESDAMNHSWNMVKLGENWYHMDATYDDPSVNGAGDILGYCSYKYFVKSDRYMSSAGYRGWSGGYSATDERYDNIFLTKYMTGIMYQDGKWYIEDRNCLYEIDVHTGETVLVFDPDIHDAPSDWERYPDSVNYGVYNNRFVYNTYNCIYSMQLGGETKLLKEVELGRNESITGLVVDGDVVYYRIANNRYDKNGRIESFEICDTYAIEGFEISEDVITVNYDMDMFDEEVKEECKVYVAGYDEDGTLLFVRILTDGENSVAKEEAAYYKVSLWSGCMPLCNALTSEGN